MLGLPTRQSEVATLLMEGWTNAEIADRLGISVHTVKNVVALLRIRFDAKNRTALAVCLLGKRHELSLAEGTAGTCSAGTSQTGRCNGVPDSTDLS